MFVWDLVRLSGITISFLYLSVSARSVERRYIYVRFNQTLLLLSVFCIWVYQLGVRREWMFGWDLIKLSIVAVSFLYLSVSARSAKRMDVWVRFNQTLVAISFLYLSVSARSAKRMDVWVRFNQTLLLLSVFCIWVYQLGVQKEWMFGWDLIKLCCCYQFSVSECIS